MVSGGRAAASCTVAEAVSTGAPLSAVATGIEAAGSAADTKSIEGFREPEGAVMGSNACAMASSPSGCMESRMSLNACARRSDISEEIELGTSCPSAARCATVVWGAVGGLLVACMSANPPCTHDNYHLVCLFGSTGLAAKLCT